MTYSDKVSLRKQLRKKRRELDKAAQQHAAQGLLQQLLMLNDVEQAQRIAIYLANDGEIDTQRYIEHCWQQQDKQPYMPIVRQHNGANTLLFAPLNPDTKLVYNHYGIAEPDVPESQYIEARALDLVLMPLVGFDEKGNRIGMGGGFYDQTFAFKHQETQAGPLLIGLAHECQKVAAIDAENWDIPLSMVVTDQNIYSTS